MLRRRRAGGAPGRAHLEVTLTSSPSHDRPLPEPPPEAGGPGAPMEADVLWRRRPRAALAALAALSLAAFCFVTTENLPVGLLQVISTSLRVPLTSVGFLVTVYAAVVVVASAPLTQLTRRLPRRALVCSLLAVFVVATLASAVAPSYAWLLCARVVTAMAQAVFWSVVAVTAVSLFGPEVRGRAVAGVLGGGSVSVVLGVPAGTWLGQQGGWRFPFLVLSCVGVVILLAVAVLLPPYHPASTHAATGSYPDRRRYRMLIATTVLVVGGYFTTYTYVTRLLTHVSGLPVHDLSAVLLATGVADAIGVGASGLAFDRWPRAAGAVPVAGVGAAMLALYALAPHTLAAVALQAAASLALGAFIIANQNRVLIVAPGSTDVASAWMSASFNIGIAGGSLVGGLVVPSLGARATALVGGALALSGFAVAARSELGGPPVASGSGGLRRWLSPGRAA